MRRFVAKVLEIYQPYRWAMVGALGFIAVSQAIGLISPYLHGKVIDSLISRKPAPEIAMFVAFSVLMSLLQTAISYLRDLYDIRHIDFAVPRHLSKITLSRMLQFSIGQHVSENSGIKQSVMSRGQHSLMALARQMLYQVIPTATEIILLLGILIWYSTVLGAMALLGAIAYGVYIIYVNRMFRADHSSLEEMHNQHSRLEWEVICNVDTVLANAQGSRAAAECDESHGGVSDFDQKVSTRFSRFSVLRNVIDSVLRASLLSTGIYLVFQGRHSIGELVMFLSWANQALGRVSMIGNLHRQLVRSYVSVDKFFEMLAIEPDVKVLPNPVRPAKFAGRIEFRNVTFSYRARCKGDGPDPESALKNVSFVIEPGETVAFVGESGAGKTTIVHMLLRAQDPDEGQITIDGHDLRVLDLDRYRQAVGLVDQDVSLFDRELRYNVTFGMNGRAASVTDAELDRVAEMASINRFFPRLEQGYDTIIGERGVKLSGGERQRVGIARALVKQPDILIFDEATSNLDSENEAIIRASIAEASRGRTTIIIAHRFSTIRRVDKIFVLEKGRVVGEGTHGELARNCEAYQRLIRNQVL